MAIYLKGFGTKQTPQTEPILGSDQVPNAGGGYGWAVDDWVQLDRFLILGTEGGTYYASQQKLTRDNLQAVERCLTADPIRAVGRIFNIHSHGRAPKTDPALFALAMAASSSNDLTRSIALAVAPRMLRTGTQLFHFIEFVTQFRGWGAGLCKAVAGWYEMDPRDLAYQVVKYQQRDGWSHRDLLRLAHPVPKDDLHKAIYHWIVKGWDTVGETPHPDATLRFVWAFERAKQATTTKEIVRLITDEHLPREAIPTQWLKEKAVWEALLVEMPLTAMIRNLATMTRVGLLRQNSAATDTVVSRLGDAVRLLKARVHPITLLTALLTYQSGHSMKGTATWAPLADVNDALDQAFYLAFPAVDPANQRILVGLDVSGSMAAGMLAGVQGLTPRVASAALAMVTLATEPQTPTIMGFTGGFVPLNIQRGMRLDAVCRYINTLPFDSTDCSLPIRWALKRKLPVDCFQIFTDNETNSGPMHPAQALREYRKAMGIDAKLIVVGMTAGGFSIADPKDPGMLDVVGFDTATPALMSHFARGLADDVGNAPTDAADEHYKENME